MTKYIFLALLFIYNYSNAQYCNIELNELIKITKYDQSEFETYALENDFSYNASDKTFWCNKIKNGNKNLLSLSFYDNKPIVIYSFFDNKFYLKIKKQLEKGTFEKTEFKENSVSHYYKYKDKNFILNIASNNELNHTVYMISIF